MLPPRARTAVALFLLAAVRVALELVRLWDWPERTWQWEEAYNAAEAWALADAGLGGSFFALQYKSFCGGCSVLAAAAAPAMALMGDHLVAWKLAPILWSALAVPVGWLAGTRRVGPAAGWLLAVMLAVPTPGVADLSLLGLGNHQESLLLVLCALAARRPLAQGLWLGLGVWFARISLWAVVPIALAAAWEHRRDRPALARLLGGALLGYAPALIPAGAGDQGAYDLSFRANFFADGLAFGAERLVMLSPERAAWAMFPRDPSKTLLGGAMFVGAVGGLVTLIALRRWLFVGMLGCWTFFWAASGFDVPFAGPGAPAIQQRYHAPWLFLFDLFAAMGAGALWSRGGWKRWAAAVVFAGPVVAHVGGWVYALRAYDEDPAILRYRAAHLPSFAGTAARKMPIEDIARAHSDDARLEGTLRTMEGWALAQRGGVVWDGLDPQVVEALAMTAYEPSPDLAALTLTQRVGWARGSAVGRAFRVGAPPLGGPVAPMVTTWVQRGCAEDTSIEEPCPGCGRSCSLVGGWALLTLCGAMRHEIPASKLSACLAEGVEGREDAGAVLYGAAFFWQGPLRDPVTGEKIAAALPVGGDGWRAGLAHPIAGLDRPPGAAAFFRGQDQGRSPQDARPPRR